MSKSLKKPCHTPGVIYPLHTSPPIRLSQFLELSEEKRKEFLEEMEKTKKKLVEIFCYCLMPNHFHLLAKQLEKNGILNFLRLAQNSDAKYFNLKYKKVGSLLQGQFKAVRAETDEQLLHLSRYIHLNPYSSFVVKSIEDLESYPWSSLPHYLTETKESFLKERINFRLFLKSERLPKIYF